MPWIAERAAEISWDRLQALMEQTVAEARRRICARPKRVLLLPPDITRMHSGAGRLTEILYNLLGGEADVHVIPDARPARAAHAGGKPADVRLDSRTSGFTPTIGAAAACSVGEIPGRFVDEATQGAADWPMPIVLNRMLMEEPWDLIINVGHVVPHEVLGFANHNKNYFIGLGGKDLICAAHMAAACCGIENNLGNLITPVRACFNRAEDEYLGKLPDLYVQVVLARNERDQLVHTGVYVGDDLETYLAAARQSREENITLFDEPMREDRVRDAGRRVLQHVGGEQGGLPHADGTGRRRRAGRHRPRPEAVRRAAGGRRVHPQVRLRRHAARDGAIPPAMPTCRTWPTPRPT